MPGGPANKEYTWETDATRGSVQAYIEAIKDVFARCSKKKAIQVCIKL
jgi:hypothetical protein